MSFFNLKIDIIVTKKKNENNEFYERSDVEFYCQDVIMVTLISNLENIVY